MSSYNSSKLDQISTYRLAKESTAGRRGNKPTRKLISLDRPIWFIFICEFNGPDFSPNYSNASVPVNVNICFGVSLTWASVESFISSSDHKCRVNL